MATLECVRRVDGRLVRWVLNAEAPICKEIKKNCPKIWMKGCIPHNGFYQQCQPNEQFAHESFDVSHMEIEKISQACR